MLAASSPPLDDGGIFAITRSELLLLGFGLLLTLMMLVGLILLIIWFAREKKDS